LGDRVTQIAQGSSVVQIGYDADGRRTSLTLPNGVIANYSYNADSQLTGITYTQAGSVLGDLAYTYDSAGRVATVGGSLAHTTLPPAVASASYNADNQLTQWGGTAMMYDPNGNLTSDGAHTYTWSPRNLLASIDGGNTASFVYGPFGRRVSKTVYGTTSGYLYDGPNVVQELSGSTPSANLLSGGLDEIFTRTDSTGAYSYLRDGLGSTLALTDSTGTVQQTYTYGPYGYTSSSGNTTSNSYEYTGREADATGLYYFRARYYNPNTSRFISEDPIGFAGDGANLFAYVGDDPTDFIDPFGMDRKDPCYKNPCVQGALLKGAATTGLDAIGILPEGGTVSAAFSLWHGAAGVSNGTKILGRVAFAGGLIATVGAAHDLQSPQESALSTTVTGLQATAGGFGIAKGLIEDIPVAGQAIAIGATALDLVGTGLGVAECYQ
jgi:RHS repeat-associated protein